MSTRSSLWGAEDEKRRGVHIYWELAERIPEVAAPIYIAIEVDGKETPIRLPKEIGEKVLSALGGSKSWDVI